MGEVVEDLDHHSHHGRECEPTPINTPKPRPIMVATQEPLHDTATMIDYTRAISRHSGLASEVG